MADADRCVCCGTIVPEGRMVCPQCEVHKRNIVHCAWCDEEYCVWTGTSNEKEASHHGTNKR